MWKYVLKHVKNIYKQFTKSESSKSRSRKAESFKCILQLFFLFLLFVVQAYFMCVYMCGKVSSLSGENSFSLHANLFTLYCCTLDIMYSLNACYVASHYARKNLILKIKKKYVLFYVYVLLLCFFFCFEWLDVDILF